MATKEFEVTTGVTITTPSFPDLHDAQHMIRLMVYNKVDESSKVLGLSDEKSPIRLYVKTVEILDTTAAPDPNIPGWSIITAHISVTIRYFVKVGQND